MGCQIREELLGKEVGNDPGTIPPLNLVIVIAVCVGTSGQHNVSVKGGDYRLFGGDIQHPVLFRVDQSVTTALDTALFV